MQDYPVKVADKEAGDWKDHPRFRGVQVKNLLTTADNVWANVNVVRVPPGREIGMHGHSEQVETIHVLAGESILTVCGAERRFCAGQIVAVPVSVAHSLRNDGQEMVELLTIFTPPLS